MFRSFLLLALAICGSSVRADVIAYIDLLNAGNIDRLEAYGHDITYFRNPTSLSLTDLVGFDSVILASSRFGFGEAIGNTVADFADAGGGVVVTMFQFKGTSPLRGRIATPAYSPWSFDPRDDIVIGRADAVAALPLHPILAGVNVDNLSSEFVAPLVVALPGSTQVAGWGTANGMPAIGYRPTLNSTVVMLNFYTGDNYTPYIQNPDNDRMLSNAVAFSQSVVPEPSLLPLAIGCAMFWARRRR